MMTISPSSMTTRTSSRRTNWAPQAPTVERNAGLVSAFFIWKISPAKTSASKKQPHGTETKNLAFFEKGACIHESLRI